MGRGTPRGSGVPSGVPWGGCRGVPEDVGGQPMAVLGCAVPYCSVLRCTTQLCAVLTGVRLCSPCPAVLGQTRTHHTVPYPYTYHSCTTLCCTCLLEGQPSRA